MAKYVLNEESDGDGRPDFFKCCKCKNLFECYNYNFYIKFCPMCGDKLEERLTNSILEPLGRKDLSEYNRRLAYERLRGRLITPIINHMREYLQYTKSRLVEYRKCLKHYREDKSWNPHAIKPNPKDFVISWKDFKKKRKIC